MSVPACDTELQFYKMLPLRETDKGSLCIVSYKRMWIYNDLNRNFFI